MMLDQEKRASEQKMEMMRMQFQMQLERIKLESQMGLQQEKMMMEQQLKDIPAGTDQLIATIKQMMEQRSIQGAQTPEVLPPISQVPAMNINVSLANPNRTVTLSAPNPDGSKTGFISDEMA
jgi:hypothetical protein